MNEEEQRRWERIRRRNRRLDRWGLLAEPDFVIPLGLMLAGIIGGLIWVGVAAAGGGC